MIEIKVRVFSQRQKSSFKKYVCLNSRLHCEIENWVPVRTKIIIPFFEFRFSISKTDIHTRSEFDRFIKLRQTRTSFDVSNRNE